MQKTVFSGIQPSGTLSLGNYLGALKRFGQMQANVNALYCIVDLHAITVRQNPEELRQRTYELAAWYLACGLNPKQCTLFVQSHVPAHAELGWILGCFTMMGELERMTQYKDKAQKHKQNINAGLFSYPSLMAADILLYQTHEVPVGDDQKQHIELARNISQRVNNAYGDIFTVPEAVIPQVAARIKDLQEPTRKMSKSDEGQGTVFLSDAPSVITKKIKRAVTDTHNSIRLDEQEQPGIANLLAIYAACHNISPQEALSAFAGQGYGNLKQVVAESVVAVLEPLQAEHKRLLADKTGLDAILQKGAEKAAAQAAPTLHNVKQAVGFTTP